MPTRQEIIQFCRQYIGIPYKHQGRNPKSGLDCVGLLILIGRHFDLYTETIEQKRYSMDPSAYWLKDGLDKNLTQINMNDISIADILLMKIDVRPQHVAIISNYSSNSFGMIHCHSKVGKVVEHRLSRGWFSKVIATYQIPGVID